MTFRLAMRIISSLSFFFVSLVWLHAEEAKLDWRVAATASGLDDAQIGAIEKQGFVVVDESLVQAYTVYSGWERSMPRGRRTGNAKIGTLITPDLLIAVANACLDDVYLRTEALHAVKFADWLHQLRDGVANSPVKGRADEAALLAAGRHRAEFVLGVSLRLMGEQASSDDPATATLIEQESSLIRQRSNQHRPSWTSAIAGDRESLHRFSRVLAGYEEARAWLSELKFDVNNDSDLIAMVLIGEVEGRRSDYVIGNNPTDQPFFDIGGYREYRYGLPRIAGYMSPSVRAGLDQIRSTIRSEPNTAPGANACSPKDFAAEIRKILADHAGALQFPLTITTEAGIQVLDDVVAVTPAADAGLGLGVFLGSDVARRELRARAGEPSIAAIQGSLAKQDMRLYGIGGAYWSALRALSAPCDPQAPAFMNAVPWGELSLQTAMAGWAQMSCDRPVHIRLACCMDSGSGPAHAVRIVPQPEFFSKFADFLERASDLEPPLSDPRIGSIAWAVEARVWADMLRSLGTKLPPDDYLSDVDELCGWCGGVAGREPSQSVEEEMEPDATGRIDIMAPARRRLESIRQQSYRPLIELLLESAEQWEGKGKLPWHAPSFGKQWRSGRSLNQLAFICRRLEALCHKQLRDLPLSKDEVWFLDRLGPDLRVMASDYSSSSDRIEDTAMRVFPRPLWQRGDEGHYGTAGRPLALYVLYPETGGPTLYRGAVLSYYEVASKVPLTAEVLRKQYPSGSRPAAPDWMRHFPSRPSETVSTVGKP